MYIKIKKGTPLWTSLFIIMDEEQKRAEKYILWQRDNLPAFNDEVLQERHHYCMYPYAVAWTFEGDVDAKVWRKVKGYPGYYEPNNRTKFGKAMQEEIATARGKMFNRIKFFDIFKTSIPRFGSSFVIPNGFYNKVEIYMIFDDGNYIDVINNFPDMVEEITRGQWEKAMEE